MVDRNVVHDKYAQCECNTERHRNYHHSRVGGTCHPDEQMVIEHIVHEVDQRYSRYNEQGTGE